MTEILLTAEIRWFNGIVLLIVLLSCCYCIIIHLNMNDSVSLTALPKLVACCLPFHIDLLGHCWLLSVWPNDPLGQSRKENGKVVNLCKKNDLLASCFIYVHVIILWGIYLAVFSMLRMRDQWQLTRTTFHFLRDRQARSNHKKRHQCNKQV